MRTRSRPCKHNNLVLVSESDDRVRCRHCHLTIKRAELSKPYCPECYEATGARRDDFETVTESPAPWVQYRCEDCGVLIQPQGPTERPTT